MAQIKGKFFIWWDGTKSQFEFDDQSSLLVVKDGRWKKNKATLGVYGTLKWNHGSLWTRNTPGD